MPDRKTGSLNCLPRLIPGQQLGTHRSFHQEKTMRKRMLRVAPLTIASLLMFGPNISNTFVSSAQKTVDPVCVDVCKQKLFQCILDATLNGDNDKKCISVYRTCVAHCK